jgi:fatty acid desaturase
MNIFRYKEDITPTSLIILLFGLDLLVYFSATSVTALCSWFLISIIFKMYIGSWNHHHQHVNTFHSTLLNRLLEIVFTFHTGVTTNLWVLHHNLGHHQNYLDQSKDESGWKRKDGSTMGRLEYTATIALSGYIRGFNVGKEFPKYQTGLVGMGLANLLLLTGFFFHSPLNAFFVFLLPMTVSYLATCWTTYHHHSGLDSDDHHHASYNVMNRWHNLLTGNLGFHTAHHMKGLHWSKLPAYHQTIRSKIPDHLILEHSPGLEGLFQKALDWMEHQILGSDPLKNYLK